MLDNSFIYQKDFDIYRKKFQQQGLDDLYKKLYSHARLVEFDEQGAHDINKFLGSYSKNLKLISDLVKDNYALQHRVHQLGIKNRIKKKLGRYKAPETVKSYVTQSELEDMLNGSFVRKNYLPLASFTQEALELFKNLSNESFEDGLRSIQSQIKSPAVKNPPLVSIIIPSRDGLHHLKRLFSGFEELTSYAKYEIIVVDNASSDGTMEYLEDLKGSLNLRIIRNNENKSFSESNNLAVKKARGTYLLFLNNDVMPTDGWLNHMVSTAVKDKSVGAVGAKLVYPYKPGFENSYKIQHGGLGFRIENDFIRPVNVGMGAGFLTRNIQKEEEKAGVTAACLLIEKKKFKEVGGFDQSYWYGYEDVDLCLKLHERGYRNIINNAAVLFHYEFGTQDKQDSSKITGYRKNNIKVFKDKWQKKLYPMIWQSLLGENNLFTDKQPHFGFIVTESSDKTAAGDYFTAKELGSALENKGNKVSYIGVRNTPDPYDIDPDIDVVVSMIDGFDISKVSNTKAVKIAWCRNWFKRWTGHPYFRQFDIVLTNSEKAQKYFKDNLFIDSYIFKIATNKERFTKSFSKEELLDFKSDICFTGNYWHVPRDILTLFDVDKFKEKYQIKIFGKDWDHVKQLKPYWQGFLEYKNIPKVYAAGKILIDDATNIVNEWGSVNSRVFDGAASGILVLTNGVKGSEQTFDGLIPTFNSREELTKLLKMYLGDEKLRQKKIEEIKEYTLSHHTYEHRASQLLEILKDELTKKTINLKLPIPSWNEAKQWGDFHFGQGLKRELKKSGFNVKLQVLPEWGRNNFAFANIVLRGLSAFKPPAHQLNIMWNISHPEDVPLQEYKAYDYIFVASKKHTEHLKSKGVENAHVLYQCFDDTVFNTKPPKNPEKYKSDILFVGNTRNKYRQIVKDIIKWPELERYDFKVYGKGWEKFIDKKYIAGDHIDNAKLRYYYQNTKILLNDHWEDMNRHGFVSNRLFDASASGAFIISDPNPGIKEVFGPSAIEQYKSASSLHKSLHWFLNKPEECARLANKNRETVLKNHTFSNRTDQIISMVCELRSQ